MSPENELELSFYRELSPLDKKNKIFLVQDIRTGLVFVKKVLTKADVSVYESLSKAAVSGIPRIKAVIRDDDTSIVIEEYIGGRNLREILKEHKFTEDEAAGVACSLCKILSRLHSMNPPVIHRDIKPSNVLIAGDGKPWLIDFDAAKRFYPGKSRDTELIGTAGYAAPEQYGFRSSGPETDIYGLGVLLNEMLTGKLPVEEISDGPLKSVIEKATAMDPDLRYKSAGEMLKAVESAVRPKSCAAKPEKTAAEPREVIIKSKRPDSSGRKYPLPGLDSDRLSVKIASAVGYVFLATALLSTEIESDGVVLTGSRLWLNRICMVLAVFGVITYLNNWKGIKNRFPTAVTGKRGKGSAFLGAALIFAVPVLICVIIERIVYI